MNIGINGTVICRKEQYPNNNLNDIQLLTLSQIRTQRLPIRFSHRLARSTFPSHCLLQTLLSQKIWKRCSWATPLIRTPRLTHSSFRCWILPTHSNFRHHGVWTRQPLGASAPLSAQDGLHSPLQSQNAFDRIYCNCIHNSRINRKNIFH